MFEPIDEASKDELRRNIESTIEKYERRVRVTEVVVNSNDDSNLVNVKVYGYFQLDRFSSEDGGAIADADLLVELKIPTQTTNPVG